MMHIGTSGFSYDDWVGPFYPADLKKQDWLAFYAREFKALEINYTYYRMPTARTLDGMARKVPPGFVFTIKTPQEMTHTRDADPALFSQFIEALKPIIDQAKFGTILAQFPFSFPRTRENTDYLKEFRARFGDLPVVVEFRNAHWLTRETFEFLREQSLGFCCVDEPQLKGLLPPVAVATSNTAYVRFHGRNALKWWEHEHPYERYDYTYRKEELTEWIPKIKKLNESAQAVFVFANNHYGGQGIDTARQLRLMLE